MYNYTSLFTQNQLIYQKKFYFENIKNCDKIKKGKFVMTNIKIPKHLINNQLLPKRKINKMVDNVFTETEILNIPVRIAAIANFYGFTVFNANMSHNEHSLLIKQQKTISKYNTNRIIVVNANESDTENKLSVAYELYHYLLHKNRTTFAHRQTNDDNTNKTNAQNFAMALLMPETEINKKLKEIKNQYFAKPNTRDLIVEIAETFDVSETTAEIRLRKLNKI